METILQFGIASGNLGYDFMKFLILLPIAIIIDLVIKAIKNRKNKKDDEKEVVNSDEEEEDDEDGDGDNDSDDEEDGGSSEEHNDDGDGSNDDDDDYYDDGLITEYEGEGKDKITSKNQENNY